MQDFYQLIHEDYLTCSLGGLCTDVGCTWVTTHVLFSQWLALRVTTFSLGEYSYAYIIVDRIAEQYVALDDI